MLDRKIRYGINGIIVSCVYALLFYLCLLDIEGYIGQPDDREELLCMLTGFSLGEQPVDIRLVMIKWMMGLTVLFILVGREIYDRLNNLGYIAMIRYGSYRRFYRSLMNRTVCAALLYGGTSVLVIYALYTFFGNGQVGGRGFLEISIIWISQVLLLCLLQTICMILTGGSAASVVLLILWFAMVMCGHMVMETGWIWLPANWGMYIRGARVLPDGVPDTAYYIQASVCLLLWAGTPFMIKRKWTAARRGQAGDAGQGRKGAESYDRTDEGNKNI